MKRPKDYADQLERLAALHDRSCLDITELFLERAAIREEGNTGMSRAEAERLAMEDVERMFA